MTNELKGRVGLVTETIAISPTRVKVASDKEDVSLGPFRF